MTATNDLLLLTVQYTYLGQLCLNRFWYRPVLFGGNPNTVLEYMAAEFKTLWWDELEPYLSTNLTCDHIQIINYSQPSELYLLSVNDQGDIATTAAPPWLSATMFFNRAGAGYRYPQKRIVGFNESQFNASGLEASFVSALQAIGDDICLFSDGIDGTQFHYAAITPAPVIGGQNPFVDPTGYRVQFPSICFDARLGTQKTRKGS